MKYLKTFILFLIIIFNSCTHDLNKLEGEYRSNKLSLFEKIKYKTPKRIQGMQLTLRNDSTYHYNTCGILIDGFWKKNGDSLVMSVSQIKYKHEKLKDSIPSIVYTENIIKESVQYRKRYFGIVTKGNPVEAAIRSIIRFDQLIVKGRKPSFIFRIEDGAKELYNLLEESGYKVKWDESRINEKYNARDHEGWDSLKPYIESVDQEHKNLINAYCKKYGYNPLF